MNRPAKLLLLSENRYNHYSCFSTEDIIKANAQAMVDLGLADAGYDYVVPDCGWT